MSSTRDADELAALRPRWWSWWDGARQHSAEAPSYVLTRFVMLRLLGLVYLGAFASLYGQLLPLLGHDGLLPADDFLERAREHFGSTGRAAWALPSLFWLGISDAAMEALALLGLALSAVVLAGFANAPILLVLWAVYLSFVHVGQTWYGYGWETQLLETGFLAVFLAPPLDPRPFPRDPPPTPVIVLYRWLAVRIMLGAGLIKLRGDPCWRALTCLDFHFETQPVPNPLSRAYHLLPPWAHRAGVLFNHLTELIAPWFAFGPRLARHLSGAAMALFQLVLISSGNLSFLNWLTLVPILACFDDGVWSRLLPRRLVEAAYARAVEPAPPSRARRAGVAALVLAVSALSVAPIANLLSDRQAMNTAHEPFALVNSYGAFGSVGQQRDEVVLEGTLDPTVTASTAWVPYELPCKPGALERRPCVAGLYQRRLDWQLWFAAMGSVDDEPWMVHVVYKLLAGDRALLELFAGDPFPDRPPRFVRVSLYRYRFAAPDSGAWWTREYRGEWLPPLSLHDPRLVRAMVELGWRLDAEE